MFRNQTQKYIKQKLVRANVIKYEYLSKIIRSLFSTLQIKEIRRVLFVCIIKNNKFKRKKMLSQCSLTSNSHSYIKKVGLQRRTLNKLLIENKISNFSVNSW